MKRRRMTGASKTGITVSDVHDTVKHRREDQRAGLLQNSGELAVQFCEKPTRIGSLSRVRFDQCAQHRRDQRRAHSVSHHVADTNASSVIREPCDMKKIAAHHAGWQVTMIKAQSRRFMVRTSRKTWIGVWHQRLL